MSTKSYNGWPVIQKAVEGQTTKTITPIPGVNVVVRDNPNVEEIFSYLIRAYNAHVAPVKQSLGVWGYSLRPDTNDTALISCHGSGTAVDINATQHPNGVPAAKTFSPLQIRQINHILDFLEGTVTWGGIPGSPHGWRAGDTPDAMHFELSAGTFGKLGPVADKIRALKSVHEAGMASNPHGHLVALPLGRPLASPFNPMRQVDMRDFLTIEALPPMHNWPGVTQGAIGTEPWGMMLNDRIGDCTCAGVGHAVMLASYSAVTNAPSVVPSDDDVLALYEQVSGYDPTTGQNDNGAMETDIIHRWRVNGFPISGQPQPSKILAAGRLGPFGNQTPQDYIDTVKEAVLQFGFAYVGTMVPSAWEAAPDVWDIPPAGQGDNIVGGHAVIIIGWDPNGFQLVSWGRVFTVTYDAFTKYFDEAHAIVTQEWVNSVGISPDFNLQGLLDTLARLDQNHSEQVHPGRAVRPLALASATNITAPAEIRVGPGGSGGNWTAPVPGPDKVITKTSVDRILGEAKSFLTREMANVVPSKSKFSACALAGLVAGLVALVTAYADGRSGWAPWVAFVIFGLATGIVKAIPAVRGISNSQLQQLVNLIVSQLQKSIHANLATLEGVDYTRKLSTDAPKENQA